MKLPIWDDEIEDGLRNLRSCVYSARSKRFTAECNAKNQTFLTHEAMKLYLIFSTFLMVIVACLGQGRTYASFTGVVIVGVNAIVFWMYDSVSWSKSWMKNLSAGRDLEHLSEEITRMLDTPRELRKETGSEFCKRMSLMYAEYK